MVSQSTLQSRKRARPRYLAKKLLFERTKDPSSLLGNLNGLEKKLHALLGILRKHLTELEVRTEKEVAERTIEKEVEQCLQGIRKTL